jgi:hypothetical protein
MDVEYLSFRGYKAAGRYAAPTPQRLKIAIGDKPRADTSLLIVYPVAVASPVRVAALLTRCIRVLWKWSTVIEWVRW